MPYKPLTNNDKIDQQNWLEIIEFLDSNKIGQVLDWAKVEAYVKMLEARASEADLLRVEVKRLKGERPSFWQRLLHGWR